MYLTPTDKYWAIDLEGDDLLDKVTRVWCLAACNIITGEEWSSGNVQEIGKWIALRLAEGCKLVGHNLIGYDAPVLNRLVNCKIAMGSIVDTLLLSMVYSPSLTGGHSLGSWGHRLKFPKGEFNDFSRFSPEMLEYCKQDARLCRLIYRNLVTRMRKIGFTEHGLEIEHRAWQLVKQQQKNGFHFNIQEAHSLYSKLRQEENDIRDRVHEIWPPTLELVSVFKQARKKDGSYTKGYLNHLEQYERVTETKDGGYQAFDFIPFNIGSPVQRTEKLLESGWQPRPDERTPTGQPKPTSRGRLVPSLEEFVQKSGDPGPALIAQWIEYNARANMINTWIEAYNEKSGCIHGTLWLANTLRYRHSNPNTANIPAVRVDKDDRPLFGAEGVYTYEARNLWGSREPSSRRLVGVDAAGIQLRVLAHYLNNKEFTDAVLGGDPHSYNQRVGGFSSRAVAKTFIYAFLLGAGDAKVGQIISGSTREGKAIKARFIGDFPGLGELLNDLEQQVTKTGRIILCDGTPLIVTAPHTRLGYLLQGDESRIMKQAMILTQREIQRRKLDVLKVCDVHDEFQYDVLLEHVEEFTTDVLPQAFKRAGEIFNYRVPIECSTAVGETWSETH